jgi:diacylglycerol kinase
MPALSSKNNLKESFMAAFRGLFILIRNERNARIHFLAVTLITIAGFVLRINSTHWAIILLLFALIISTEMINSAMEKLADLVEPDLNNEVKYLKDLAAGAVLWASMVSVIIGIIIFAPYILKFFKNIPNP